MSENPGAAEYALPDYGSRDNVNRPWWYGYVPGLALVASLALVGCAQKQTLSESQVLKPPNSYVPEDTVVPLGEEVNFDLPVDTTEYTPILPETTTTTTVQQETTTMVTSLPSTTVTTMPPRRICKDGGLYFTISGDDGKAVPAQISIDYMIGDQKVDQHGKPIPSFKGYSVYAYVNQDLPPNGGDEGKRDGCLPPPPSGAKVSIEAYSKQMVNGNFMNAIDRYGKVATPIFAWTGPFHTVDIRLPRTCRNGGSTGDVVIDSIDRIGSSEPLVAQRIVAWELSSRALRGFGVIDGAQESRLEQKKLSALKAGQGVKYVVQVQAANDLRRSVKIQAVPVASCRETHFALQIGDDGSCNARMHYDDQVATLTPYACEYNDHLYG